MKRSNKTNFVLVTLVTILAASFSFAKEPLKPVNASESTYNDFSVFSEDHFSQIENNLIIGVKSGNAGLQTSSAYFLGEMKSDNAFIPLLKLIKNGKTEEARIIAALSLYKIKSKIGMYQLKRLAQNDDSELVRNVFDRLYKVYTANGYSF
jgi:hypothetical protein